ncbi:glycosyltransferase [Gammaproteobacteria bacterium AS21]
MSFFIILTNRLLKVLGALVKGFSFIFHFLFPNKRFTIPSQRNALFKSVKPSIVPRIIWQTNYTNKVALPVYINYLFNRIMSPTYEYRYFSTEQRLLFIKEHASDRVYKAFTRLTDGASQADLWRLFILNYYGGVYMDIDAHLVWPLSYVIDDNDEEVFILNKKHFTNYFMATKAGNPVLQKTIDIVVKNIEENNVSGGVYDLTGPTALNLAIAGANVHHRFYRITCNQGTFTNEYFQYIDKPRGKWTYVSNEQLLNSNELNKTDRL